MSNSVIVLILVYNEGQYLDATLRSVLSQTFTHFDLYVSCNQCTDDSHVIARKFQVLDQRVTVLETPSHLPSFDHWRWVIDQISNKNSYTYALSIGGHDIISSDYIEALVREFQRNSNYVLCYPSQAYAIDEVGRIKFQYPPMPQTFKGGDFFQSIPIILSLRYNVPAFGIYRAGLLFDTVLRNCYAADHICMGHYASSGIIKAVAGPYIQLRDTSSGVSQYINKHFGVSHKGTMHNLAVQLGWISAITSELGPTNNSTLNDAARACTFALYILRYLEQFSSSEEINAFFSNDEIGTFFSTLSRLSSLIDSYIVSHDIG